MFFFSGVGFRHGSFTNDQWYDKWKRYIIHYSLEKLTKTIEPEPEINTYSKQFLKIVLKKDITHKIKVIEMHNMTRIISILTVKMKIHKNKKKQVHFNIANFVTA